MASSEETQIAVDPKERKVFKRNVLQIGIEVLIVTGFLMCNFLIPGLSLRRRVSLWVMAAAFSVETVISIRLHVEEFGWSVPQIEKPKMLRGADLC